MLFPRRLMRWMPALLLASGCATTSPLRQLECTDPDAQLASLLAEYDALASGSCGHPGMVNCEAIRSRIERLSMTCPAHDGSTFAVALISYEEGDPVRAQQYLDRLLERPGIRPDAAALRARLAIDEGNLPFAKRLVEQQLRLTPDHAGLHEVLASVFFLTRDTSAAARELSLAGRLGAPAWRVAYHQGLVAEIEGRLQDAERLFQESATANPGWPTPSARLRALRAARDEAHPAER